MHYAIKRAQNNHLQELQFMLLLPTNVHFCLLFQNLSFSIMEVSLSLILLLFLDYYKRRLNLSLNLEANLVYHVYCKPIIQTTSFCTLACKNKLEIRNSISSIRVSVLAWKNVLVWLFGRNVLKFRMLSKFPCCLLNI